VLMALMTARLVASGNVDGLSLSPANPLNASLCVMVDRRWAVTFSRRARNESGASSP
jgi:hypothetical protein